MMIMVSLIEKMEHRISGKVKIVIPSANHFRISSDCWGLCYKAKSDQLILWLVPSTDNTKWIQPWEEYLFFFSFSFFYYYSNTNTSIICIHV